MDSPNPQADRLPQSSLPFSGLGAHGEPQGREKAKEALKTCRKCLRELPATLEFFTKERAHLASLCKTCLKEKNSAYWRTHKKTLMQYKRDWARKNPDKEQARYQRKRPWYEANTEKRNQQAYANNRRLKEEVFAAYGHICVCCGESDTRFLTVEHTNRDGAAHRRKVGGGGVILYRDLKRRGYPRDGYCLFCANCNWATRFGDPCPHRSKKRTKQHSPTKKKAWNATYASELRHETLIAYGHRCVCCGEESAAFLTIEHLKKGQWQGKRPRSSKGTDLYRSLKKQGWPTNEYAVLCFSCNWVTRHNEPCPHRERETIALPDYP